MFLKFKIMSVQKTNFLKRTRSLLLPNEPYEMTYWKEKLHSPFHRFQQAVKNLWLWLYIHPGKKIIPIAIEHGR